MDSTITTTIIQDDDTYEPSIWRQFFDPFEIVRYNSTFRPNSRSYHTDLLDKCNDTFQVFDGGTTIWLPKNQWQDHTIPLAPPDFRTRPGLFDYLTLGIFRLAHILWFISGHLLFEAYDRTKKSTGLKKLGYGALVGLLALPFGIIGLVHVIGNGIIRRLTALVATIAFLPVIVLSHAISQAIKFVAGFVLGYMINKLDVTKIEKSTEGLSQNASLLKALKDTSMTNAGISINKNKITFKRPVLKVEGNTQWREYLIVGHTYLSKLSMLRKELSEFNPRAREAEGYNMKVRG